MLTDTENAEKVLSVQLKFYPFWRYDILSTVGGGYWILTIRLIRLVGHFDKFVGIEPKGEYALGLG